MTSQPTISAIMIVKNEEEHLPKCLKSIREHVDEIIVVDTGSTDNTMDIAESYGAKIFEHPWEDHFSKHRNQSKSYATGEWLLQIDADEELYLDSVPSLKDAVQSCNDVDAILITLDCRWGGGRKSLHNSLRLFKNLANIHYEGRVHNEVVGVRTGKYMPIRLLHYGYDADEDTKKRKFKRTVDLLLQDVKEDPQNPRGHHYLGISYLNMNIHDKAIKEAETAIGLCRNQGNQSDLYTGSYYVASSAYMGLGNLEKAEYWALNALKHYPQHLDSIFILMKVYFEKHDLPIFRKYNRNYLDLLQRLEKNSEEFGTAIYFTAGFKWMGYLYRACALINEGLREKGEKELESALEYCPDIAHYHHLLAGFFRQKKEYKRSESEFLKALEETPDCVEILWDFAQLRKHQNHSLGADELLERLIKLKPDHENALFELGNINLKRNEFRNSIHYYERVIEIEKGHKGARVNMSLALRKLGRFEEAISHSLEIIKEHPSSVEAHSNLAYSYYAIGNYEDAAVHFIEITKLNPDQLDPHVFLAQIFLSYNDIESSVTSCDNLLNLLNLKRDIVLTSLKDLGERFLEIAEKLLSDNKPHLSKMCHGLGQILTGANPVS